MRLLIAGLALVLSGCSAAATPSPVPTPTPSPVPTAASTPTPTPAPTINAALAKWQAFDAHLTVSIPNFSGAIASDLNSPNMKAEQAWARDELAWLVGHPSAACYQGVYDTWKAMADALAKSASANDISQATAYLKVALGQRAAAGTACQ